MTIFISEVAQPDNSDASTNRMLIGCALVVVVLLILWLAGPLKRLRSFSLKFFKDIGLNMGFYEDKKPPQTKENQSVGAEKTIKNRGDRRRQAKELKDVTGLTSQIGSVLTERRKTQKPLPPNFEEQRIAQGFKYLDAGQIVEAKKCFDSVLQQNPKSADGCFGLGRVLELWGNVPYAMKFYWEATRVGDGNHPRAKDAQARLDEFCKQERHQNMIQAVIKTGRTANSFWFDGVPDGTTLARHFVALSNSEDGGTIVVGVDATSHKPTVHDLKDWEKMLDAVCRHYVTAPCVFEVLRSQQPRCIVVLIQRGLNRPYRVNNDDAEEAKIFVTDGAGDVREATPDEANDLRKKKRG